MLTSTCSILYRKRVVACHALYSMSRERLVNIEPAHGVLCCRNLWSKTGPRRRNIVQIPATTQRSLLTNVQAKKNPNSTRSVSQRFCTELRCWNDWYCGRFFPAGRDNQINQFCRSNWCAILQHPSGSRLALRRKTNAGRLANRIRRFSFSTNHDSPLCGKTFLAKVGPR